MDLDDNYTVRWQEWQSHWYNRWLRGPALRVKMRLGEWWRDRHPTDFPF